MKLADERTAVDLKTLSFAEKPKKKKKEKEENYKFKLFEYFKYFHLNYSALGE